MTHNSRILWNHTSPPSVFLLDEEIWMSYKIDMMFWIWYIESGISSNIIFRTQINPKILIKSTTEPHVNHYIFIKYKMLAFSWPLDEAIWVADEGVMVVWS